MGDAALQLRDLQFAHPGQPPLFDGFSADILAGVTLLHGDTGSGKTTLLRLLAGELQGAGTLTLHGRRFGDDPAAWRRGVCWFDARDEAFDALTPAALMAQQQALHPALDEAAWWRHLGGFGLTPHQGKPLVALSTGSRHKAALAVAVASGAPLTLLDEPFAGLDAASRAWLAQALAEAAAATPRLLLLASSTALENIDFDATVTLPACAGSS